MSEPRPFAQPMDYAQAPESFRQRFWSKVAIGSPHECWEWTAYRKPSGYGQFMVRKGRFNVASRVAVALSQPIPAGHLVCHTCDNPPCCNPSHLFVGTNSDNVLDSVSKGRARRAIGEASPSARLTEAQVREIRALDMTDLHTEAVARQFGISASSLRKVLERRTWRHVA